MDPNLANAIIAGAAGLVGAIIGAAAAIVGPLILQNRAAKRAAEVARRERRNEAVTELVATMILIAEQELGMAPAGLSDRLNRAQMALTLTLTPEEEPIREYVTTMVQTLGITTDMAARVGTLQHGGQELIDWSRGLIPTRQMRPFQFDRFDGFTVIVKPLEEPLEPPYRH